MSTRSIFPTLYLDDVSAGRGGRWRHVVALAAGLSIFALLTFVVSGPFAALVDRLLGNAPFDPAHPRITIGLWAGGNLLIAAMIPISGLLQWLIYGVRPGRLSSVLGRFRWRWFAEAAMIIVPIWVVITVVTQLMQPAGSPVFSATTISLGITALVTIPLQAAGEEYLFRGLFFRAIAGLIPNRRSAVIAAVAGSAALFAVFHAPGNGWAAVYYFGIGVCFAILTQVTGGLEASSIAHATGNTLLTLPIVFAGQLDNLTATSGPVLLLPLVIMALASWLLLLRARRSRALTNTTPQER